MRPVKPIKRSDRPCAVCGHVKRTSVQFTDASGRPACPVCLLAAVLADGDAPGGAPADAKEVSHGQ